MKLITESYTSQVAHWPEAGRHILAQFDDTSIVVYQAYCPAIGHFAAKHGYFGHGFRFNRMSWIKPGFLWMMYRSGWGSKEGQEVILAVRLRRSAFNTIFEKAVHSQFSPQLYRSKEEWRNAAVRSSVILQWDPDRDPVGTKVERRAIQLGLRGDVLTHYARDWIIEIEDLSDFVGRQRQHARSGDYAQLVTPRETVYPVTVPEVAARLELSTI